MIDDEYKGCLTECSNDNAKYLDDGVENVTMY